MRLMVLLVAGCGAATETCEESCAIVHEDCAFGDYDVCVTGCVDLWRAGEVHTNDATRPTARGADLVRDWSDCVAGWGMCDDIGLACGEFPGLLAQVPSRE